jgi:hypothetical protein
MNRKLAVWLIGVAIFVIGGGWLYRGLGYYQSPSDPTIDPNQVYYGGAIVAAGVVVMLLSRRVSR